ncbi:MAG: HYC_CC_PP family protein [Chitinophagaceae bacterium]
MKKTIVILLMLIYGTATMGATAHLHFCMNEFVGWSLFQNKDNKCGKCGMQDRNKEGCCKDEHKLIKLKIDQQKTDNSFVNKLSLLVLTIPEFEIELHPALQSLSGIYVSLPPPDIGWPSLNILHSQFLI